ncbi:WD40 repeat domain-containing protein [Thalassotalea euphylliae]|uniref:WD40 repeat domain-containing protein n=1 Tax=Thalassotalea euphylliae TaxID=1655234 RepID=UPI00363FCDA0
MTDCYRLVYVCFLGLATALISGCSPSDSEPLERWRHAAEGARAADISNDGTLSVVSSIHHGISVWDLDNNALKFTWSQQQDNADNLVLAIDIADDNSQVLTANRDTFALWDAVSGESIGYWQVRESNIRDIALSSEGRHVLIGKSNGTVVHVTMANGRRIEFLGHSEKVNTVDMLPNGRVAISGGNDFIAYVWDTQSGQVIYQFNHPSRVTKVALDPEGRYAFTADSKKDAHIWNLKTGQLVQSLQYTNRQEVFSSVRFSPDGSQLLTGAPTRKVSLWNIGTGQRLHSWRVTPREDIRPAGAVVYSAAFRDNNHFITESSSGFAELWPLPQ